MKHSDSSTNHFTTSLSSGSMVPWFTISALQTIRKGNCRVPAVLVGGMVRTSSNLMRDRCSFDTAHLQVGSKCKNKRSKIVEGEITENNRENPGERPRIIRVVFRSGPPHRHSRY